MKDASCGMRNAGIVDTHKSFKERLDFYALISEIGEWWRQMHTSAKNTLSCSLTAFDTDPHSYARDQQNSLEESLALLKMQLIYMIYTCPI